MAMIVVIEYPSHTRVRRLTFTPGTKPEAVRRHIAALYPTAQSVSVIPA